MKRKRTINLSETAQMFLIENKKPDFIPELKATVYAADDAEFQEKRQKLLNREKRFNVGGTNRQPVQINDYR